MSVKQLFLKCTNPYELDFKLKDLVIHLTTDFKNTSKLSLPGQVINERSATTVDMAILFRRFLQYCNLPTKLIMINVDLGMKERLYRRGDDYHLFVIFKYLNKWRMYCSLNQDIVPLTEYEDWVYLKAFEYIKDKFEIQTLAKNAYGEKFILTYYPPEARFSYIPVKHPKYLDKLGQLCLIDNKYGLYDYLVNGVTWNKQADEETIEKRYWGEDNDAVEIPGLSKKLKVETSFGPTEIIISQHLYDILERDHMVNYDRKVLLIHTKLFEEKPQLIKTFNLVEVDGETCDYLLFPICMCNGKD